MLNNTLRFVLRQDWVQKNLKKVYLRFFNEISALRNANPDVREIFPLTARKGEVSGLRINLMLPGISERHTFGGISTALEFLNGFAGLTEHLRIVVSDESLLPAGEERRFPGWHISTLGEADGPGRRMVLAQDRDSASLAVGPNDVFIGTAWWTASLAASLAQQQAQLWNMKARRFIYLIQDFEPGFYPWSARYALADATYTAPETYVPVFNTELLQRYFLNEGYAVEGALWFNPVLNEGIRSAMQAPACSREKRLLVYGRPTVERNAFPLIVMGLKRLVAQGEFSDWTFVSAGEPHAPVDLGGGCVLQSLGKLSLQGYATELRRCFAGLSLMISPHPSYPPLEMAACGMRVVTNHYGPKNLSDWSDRIRSVATPDPDSLAHALKLTLASFTAHPDESEQTSADFQQYLSGQMGFETLAQQAMARVHAG